MEDQRAVFKDAFGESSVSEEEQLDDSANGDGGISELIFGESPNWEPITEINGLWLCRDFLSPDHQSSLLSSIDKEGWFTEASHNQAMRFGDLPAWATELSSSICEVIHFSSYDFESTETAPCEKYKENPLFPPDLLWREPLFNQLIANIYQPGEGICAHVDLMRFEDGIAIVSLESSCVMHFSRAENQMSKGTNEVIMKDGELRSRIPVYLEPGSLILMWGEARYQWKHEINRNPGFQIWQGKEIDQKRRTSITLRRLCKSE